MRQGYSKGEVIDYIWQYSRYHANLLIYCEEIAQKECGQGYASLIYLFSLAENIFKSKVEDYDSGFKNVLKKLKQKKCISDKEYDFLNNEETGIRRIRNLLAHANLSKYNILFLSEDKNLLYPLTEDETCNKLYNLFSDILFNLMLKCISTDLIVPISINLDELIDNIHIQIKEISAEKLLEYKGIDYQDIIGWSDLAEVNRYRLAENSQNVSVLTEIFKNLIKSE
ncbi:hypothetical protein [Clostridium tagluense]|uniref:hypothetical protein n=1 Tax=Clostridium tagluense TaxID=360422 RepID=UPI001C6E78B1|nr:hypothetical protein [Clostridium tagluense]MBW9158672.1 hypothetical protein [Clostridium tagluense]WLC68555.1 hypothetical protein KTC93_26120 [Clostridium tagluense]